MTDRQQPVLPVTAANGASAFLPIAIVGRACVLPGALSPEALWAAVAAGQDLLSAAPVDQWRLPKSHALCDPRNPDPDRAWNDRGGYVSGFDSVWNPNGFALPAAALHGLDRLVHWSLHSAREALKDAGVDWLHAVATNAPRIGAIFGNLGFPSPGMVEHAIGVWTSNATGDPRNRFMSSGTAQILAQALNLNAGSFCLDAACASSLYAIALACEQLADRKADVMLAGAVQGADDLFLHIGFSALNALSRSGQSRPFHRDADGLIPAQGAAFVALKRLSDAERDGDHIYGVIRGIGLSNDGRGKGFLAPAQEGQQRAMAAAFLMSGIAPAAVSLLECHATGTPIGDATEIAASAHIYAAASDLPIASLKSNLGHLITTAGVAGLIKVIESMRAQKRAPSLHVESLSPALDGTPFRVLRELEDWPSKGPRIAAISAFGFGGNNAHLLVSEAIDAVATDAPAQAIPSDDSPLAIVGLGCVLAGVANRAQFAAALMSEPSIGVEGNCRELNVDLNGLRFPPHDLKRCLPQQLALLPCAQEALEAIAATPRERTAVYIGMEPDPEVARYGLRWNLKTRAREIGDSIVSALDSAAVVGCMPNIPANRVSSQFDLAGPSFTVQAGERSGTVALQLAARALKYRQIDTAVVGAVDFCCEAVQRSLAVFAPGDAAILLVLKRLADARRDGDKVFALLDDAHQESAAESPARAALRERFGHVGAAAALLDVAAASQCLHYRRHLGGRPWLSRVTRETAAGEMRLIECIDQPPLRTSLVPRLRCFSAPDRARVRHELAAGRETAHGDAKLVIVATDAEFDSLRGRADAFLGGSAPAGPAIHYRDRPVTGETAFCFAGAGASYRGMGEDLLTQLPSLLHSLAKRSLRLSTALSWAFESEPRQPSATEQLWGASALSQLHLELTRNVLGLRADAWMGYSSGETNALFGAGIWTDADALMTQTEQSGLMSHELGGDFAAVERQWRMPVRWASWTVLAPVAEVQAAITGLNKLAARVHLAIIHSDQECLIAGDAAGCAQVVTQIGSARCIELIYPLAVHVPELRDVASEWSALHTRETQALHSARIYANAFGGAYAPTRETCAQAILEQAVDTLDLRPAVLAAWNDGVRIFIEHGPGNAYGRAIRNILGERECVVVSLDRKGQGFEATLNALAALMAAGVSMRVDALHALMPVRLPPSPQRVLTMPAHPPEIRWPTRAPLPSPPTSVTDCRECQPGFEFMQPAPVIPSSHVSSAATVSTARVDSVVRDKPTRAIATQSERPSNTPREAPMSNRRRSAIADQWQSLTAIHKDFLAQQSAVHAQFLVGRERALQTLMRRSEHSPTNAPTIAQVGPLQVRSSVTAASVVPTAAAPASATDVPMAMKMAKAAHTVSSALRLDGPSGPRFSRAQLETHSSGAISEIFGEQFAFLNGFERQVRMPQPPLLLADRVTGLKAEAMSMGKGTIWTETCVCADSWYLHHGRMPAGVMIEAGQADLMLISWLGVDQFNRGERVYRLLGCELTYHGDLPKAGDCLRFDIHLDAHAAQGDVRLMFFHYDCVNADRPQLSVRSGQAGFFTDAELDASAGCIWSPQTQAIDAAARVDAPAVAITRRAFDRVHLEAFARGECFACFGPGFERAQTHSRSPAIHRGAMLLLDRVSEFDAAGGPWQRGYLRAELDIDAQQWFFDGHFKNDPCMPGTLMFEGCLQALAFYLCANGHSLNRDGWRFQPVPELPYQLQCRGQVTPKSRRLVTEVFVEEIIAGPIPTVFADLLCTVDGRKAFHARRVGLQLVPDWPMECMEADAVSDPESARAAVAPNGFRFDRQSLLACALGRPTHAFGPMYARFDGPERVARLPSPPYLFVSRVLALSGEPGVMKAGARVQMEYQIPADAWYFAENGAPVMPFAVLLEAALQPCGWLSSYVGSTLTSPSELGFRNLDGDAQLSGELRPGDQVLVTDVELLEVSATAGMIIETFQVRCHTANREIYRLRTVFGFFPPATLAAQAGLPTSAEQREWLARASDYSIDLGAAVGFWREAKRPRLAGEMLRMIDRVDGYWPSAGAAALGQLRAVKDVDADEWFFKAHFFQDPVQPGSLGLEAMVQLLQIYLLANDLDAGISNPRFQSLAIGSAHQWKYRGQVLPHHRQVHTTLEVTALTRESDSVMAVANASLWADGQRIYEATGLAVRIVSEATFIAEPRMQQTDR